MGISYQLPVISYQLPVTSYQLSAVSYQLSVISYHLPVTSYQLLLLLRLLLTKNNSAKRIQNWGKKRTSKKLNEKKMVLEKSGASELLFGKGVKCLASEAPLFSSTIFFHSIFLRFSH